MNPRSLAALHRTAAEESFFNKLPKYFTSSGSQDTLYCIQQFVKLVRFGNTAAKTVFFTIGQYRVVGIATGYKCF
jgi:hypothetical protein